MIESNMMQLHDRTNAIAASILFGANGLRRWPWYRAAEARMLEQLGREEMMHDARQELTMQYMMLGDWTEAMYATEQYLRGLWRPRFDAKSATYEPPSTPISECYGVAADDTPISSFSDSEVGELVAAIRERLTRREWELIEAVAAVGSQKEAADLCGVSKQYVHKTLLKARRSVQGDELVDSSVNPYKGAAVARHSLLPHLRLGLWPVGQALASA